jgi:hypothetical protein
LKQTSAIYARAGGRYRSSTEQRYCINAVNKITIQRDRETQTQPHHPHFNIILACSLYYMYNSSFLSHPIHPTRISFPISLFQPSSAPSINQTPPHSLRSIPTQAMQLHQSTQIHRLRRSGMFKREKQKTFNCCQGVEGSFVMCH